MKKATIFMMVLSVVSKFLGFAREVVLSNAYGASEISDAFIFSYSLASTVFSVFTAAFVTGLIPMYTKIENNEGEEEANYFINNTQNVMVLIAMIVSLFLFFFTKFSLSILLPNASVTLLEYLIPFTKITVFSIILTCFIQVLTGYLHIKNSFLVPVLTGFPTNIILIIVIYLSKSFSDLLLPIGILVSYIVQALIIFIFARRNGFRFKAYVNFKDKNLRMMLYLAIPLILGSATSTIGGLVNQGIASGTNGGISYINYATRIGNIVEGIFGVAIVSVMFPSLSKLITKNKISEAKNVFEQSLTTMILFILPCTIGMIFLARPIVEFVYLRGEFGLSELEVLMPVFITYSFGLLSYSMYGLVAKVFYSFQDTKTPMYVAIFNISLQVILGVFLSSIFGLPGITVSMVISSTVGVLILLYQSSKLFNDKLSKSTFKNILKLFSSSIVMGFLAMYSYNFFSVRMDSTLSLLLSISISIVFYLISIYLLKVDVLLDFISQFKNKNERNDSNE